MKPMLNISYSALQAPGLKEVLEEVSSACHELGIDFFMIGAVARNAWFVAHNEPPRGTRDIDFAVYIPDIERYNQLREKLIQEQGYRESPENAFCLLSSSGNQVDLLPFGEIEDHSKVLIQGKGLVSVALDGFREVYAEGLERVRLGKEPYAVCTIPSVILLKLIAFDDRPEHRIKDVKDIAGILRHYPRLEDEYIWSNYFDLYDETRSHEDVAIIGLGREIRRITATNVKLFTRLVLILSKGIAGDTPLAELLVMDSENETIEQKKVLLRNMLEGLKMDEKE